MELWGLRGSERRISEETQRDGCALSRRTPQADMRPAIPRAPHATADVRFGRDGAARSGERLG